MPRMYFILWFSLVYSYLHLKTQFRCPVPDSGKQPVVPSTSITPRCFPCQSPTPFVLWMWKTLRVCFHLGPGTQEASGDLGWVHEWVKALGKIVTKKLNLLMGVLSVRKGTLPYLKNFNGTSKLRGEMLSEYLHRIFHPAPTPCQLRIHCAFDQLKKCCMLYVHCGILPIGWYTF